MYVISQFPPRSILAVFPTEEQARESETLKVTDEPLVIYKGVTVCSGPRDQRVFEPVPEPEPEPEPAPE